MDSIPLGKTGPHPDAAASGSGRGPSPKSDYSALNRFGSVPAGTGAGSKAGSPGPEAGPGSPGPEWPLPLPHADRQVKPSGKRAQAIEIYEQLGKEFTVNFQKHAAMAHRTLLNGLRSNQSILVDGGLYTAKELDDLCDKVEEKLKRGGDEGKVTMIDLFHKWLNADPVEVNNG